ncbi:hypothetical protein JCM10908_005859 [Rhodotorula pacifica]|uniref:cation diffusion facilitator family transporter n=1 Tax=Rhodotorula pacifica TaxID=1495444 RepID=UPI00317C4C89
MRRGGYAEAYDPRVSGRVSLSQFDRSVATSLPLDLVLALAGSKLGVAVTLHASREWLFASGYSPWTHTAIVLGTGGALLGLWERSWEASRTPRRKQARSPALSLSLAFFFESIFAFLCIARIGATKFLLLASFSSLWVRGLPLSSFAGRKASDRSNAFVLTTGLIVGSYFLETLLAGRASRTGYLLLLLHLYSGGQRVELLAAFAGDDRDRSRLHANGVLLAAGWASAAALLHRIFATTSTPVNSSDAISPFSALLVSVVIGAVTLVADPLLTKSLLSHFPPVKLIRPGWPIAALSAIVVGRVGFGQRIGVEELALAVMSWQVVGHIVATDPRSPAVSSGSLTTGSSAPSATFLAKCESAYRHTRATIKIILASPESRRIYFFLCLNLAFMFVQMAYGVWTNSLGLISDSIHMFFDCLALGMGLFASVMATWPSNAVFTYGYSRVETLSGFANGIFLCLISIFIVFEAIQRLVDPPEINTGQLLTVSAVGLAVNLIGMAATGGHHGHSHGGGGGGHGHGHAHSHAQTPVRSESTPFLTMSETKSTNGHANGHSHASHARSPSTPTHKRTQSYAAGSPLLSPPPQPRLGHARSGSLAVPRTPPPPPPHSRSHSRSHSHSHTTAADASREHHAPEHGGHAHSNNHTGHGHGDHDTSEDEGEDEGEDDCHDHDEGDGGHGGHSHNMKGVFLHVLADTLGSVGVIISTLLINRYGWTGFDPLASIFIAVMIFASVVPLVQESGRILALDMGPEREDELRKALVEVSRLPGVSSFTKPRFWLLNSSTMVGSICIQLAPASSPYDSYGQPSRHYADFMKTKSRVRKTLKRHIAGLEYLTIQMEPTGGLGSADQAGG